MSDAGLRIDYTSHDNVQELTDCVQYVLEGISLDFDQWGDQYVSGPGLYIAIVTGPTVEEFADPMGDNQWPTDQCRAVCDDLDIFYDVARNVGLSNDGAIVISVDGVIQRQMVRFRDLTPNEVSEIAHEREYKEWMGSRHMSAIDTSLRPNVIATLTLSEETGRVTAFQDGTFETYQRTELGAEWKSG